MASGLDQTTTGDVTQMVWYLKTFTVLVTPVTSLKEERVFLVAILHVSTLSMSNIVYKATVTTGRDIHRICLPLFISCW